MSLTIGTHGFWRYWLRRDRLKDDKGKDLTPEKQDPQRPHICLSNLTGRQQRDLAGALDALEAHPKTAPTAEYVDLAFAAAKIAASGIWDGKAYRSFDELEIVDVPGLGYREAVQLAYAAFAGEVTPGDLGNSGSQLSTAGDSSASPADAVVMAKTA